MGAYNKAVHCVTQNMMTNFFRFTKTYTNCSEIQNLKILCFEFPKNEKNNRCILC